MWSSVLVVLLGLVAGIQADYHEEIIKGCIQDHGFNATHIQTLKTPEQIHSYIPDNKWICIASCLLERDALVKESAYKRIYNAIETKDPVTSAKHDRKELINTLNRCKAKYGENGCSFLKCLNIMEAPFKQYMIFNVG